MATPTIPNGEEYFFPIIYEGNGAGQRVGKFVPFTDNGTIANSCLFQPVAQRRLGRTPSSNGSGTTLTFSVWVKRTEFASAIREIFIANDYAAVGEALEFTASNQLNYYCIKTSPGSYDWNYVTNRTFEDTSKWYHIYVRRDTTDSTAADRVQIYVDGERVTSFATEQQSALNRTGWMNQTTYENTFGNTNNASFVRGVGYLAEMNMIDGSNPAVSTFGVTDTSTGRWVPKALTGITYGTNGFRCKFQDSSALGDDTSGNGNDLTATGMSTTNQTTDSPTQNHCIMDPNDETGSITMSEGNLKITQGGAGDAIRGSLAPTSGKYYFEITATATGADGNSAVGIQQKNVPIDSSTSLATVNSETFIYRDDGYIVNGGQSASGYTNWTQGNVIGIAMDLDNHKLYFSVNGTYINSGNPANGTGSVFNLVQNTRYAPYVVFQGSSGFVFDVNTGQRAFNTSAPTGFVALQQDNLPETAKGITGLTWLKDRDTVRSPLLFDSSRGTGKALIPSATNAEIDSEVALHKFLKGGFAYGNDTTGNTAGKSYISWSWVANGGSTSSNTDGSITSTVQANTTAGFSIFQYTGTGSNATVGHGLSSAPKWIWVKQLNSTGHFSVYLGVLGGTKISYTSVAVINSSNSTYWNNTDATSSVFSVGTNADVNGSSSTYVAYCWSEIDGFSKFGSYTGNGSTAGPFIYTGFKPAWIMVVRSDSANDWQIFDATRNPFNPVDRRLYANLTNAEAVGSTSDIFDFTANGFKVREDNPAINASGGTYAYIAFAEHPFVGDGTSPVTAR
jgi:hypothetical protein